RLVGRMWGNEHHGLPLGRHGLFLGTGNLAWAIEAAPGDAVEHAIARPLGCAREAVWPAELRRLRQRHQERRLAEGEPPRLLAEIDERRCPHAFEIAAIGREREI